MAEAVNVEDREGAFPEHGRVNKVSQKWRVFEDGVMAERMQNDEFDYKYGLNRYNRRTVREDIPVAKVVHSAEEERLQKEHFEHLQRQKQIADRDAEVARKAQEDEQRRIQLEQMSIETNDAVIASQFQTAELIESERAKVQMEMNDELIARKLQDKEKEKFQRKRMEREIAKQRKVLQREQAEVAGDVLSGRMESGGPRSQGFRDMTMTEDERVMRTDGKLEDAGDFSDFYIQPSDDMDPQEMRELRELQDEELARLLQDQEKKRGSHVNQDKLREIEDKDAEIARLIFEQEKLKVKKHKHKTNRQVSEPAHSGDRRSAERPLHKATSLPVSYPVHHENNRNEALEQRLGRISIDTSLEGQQPATHHQYHHSSPTATYLNPRQSLSHQQHSPTSQNSNDRELPPYRPPPPISATSSSTHHHQLQETHSLSRSDTPPYDRPPVPPHTQLSQPDYAEYASRPLPRTPASQENSPARDQQRQMSQDHRSPPSMYPPQPTNSSPQQGGNLFTAIDPTARTQPANHVELPQSRSSNRPPSQGGRSPPTAEEQLRSSDLNYAEHLAAQAVTGTPGRDHVEYADLNDMSPPVVQAQKRSSLQRDKKKNSCKQQ